MKSTKFTINHSTSSITSILGAILLAVILGSPLFLQGEDEIIKNRWRELGFVSQSAYMLALLKADNPSMDPARNLKGLKRGP